MAWLFFRRAAKEPGGVAWLFFRRASKETTSAPWEMPLRGSNASAGLASREGRGIDLPAMTLAAPSYLPPWPFVLPGDKERAIYLAPPEILF